MIDAIVEDQEVVAAELMASLFQPNNFIAESEPNGVGIAEFDWHSPKATGPVEIRVEVTDPEGLSESQTVAYWAE
ncbi:MAG: hypothetical protein ACJAZO_003547 [Myxococcota bacterium]